MHGHWALKRRKNIRVEKLLNVCSLERDVDFWKRWSQKAWLRRMGQDWCARRRKRSSSGCCPCGPRVHPSSRLVRDRPRLFLSMNAFDASVDGPSVKLVICLIFWIIVRRNVSLCRDLSAYLRLHRLAGHFLAILHWDFRIRFSDENGTWVLDVATHASHDRVRGLIIVFQVDQDLAVKLNRSSGIYFLKYTTVDLTF